MNDLFRSFLYLKQCYRSDNDTAYGRQSSGALVIFGSGNRDQRGFLTIWSRRWELENIFAHIRSPKLHRTIDYHEYEYNA
jgi:hypothetical protein